MENMTVVEVAKAMRRRVTDISIQYLGVASSAKIARDAKARMVLVKFAAEKAIAERRGPTLGKNAEEREREMALELTMHGDYREALAKSESATALHEEHRAMLDCLLAEQDADRWMIQAMQIDMARPQQIVFTSPFQRTTDPSIMDMGKALTQPMVDVFNAYKGLESMARETADPNEVPFEIGRKDGEV